MKTNVFALIEKAGLILCIWHPAPINAWGMPMGELRPGEPMTAAQQRITRDQLGHESRVLRGPLLFGTEDTVEVVFIVELDEQLTAVDTHTMWQTRAEMLKDTYFEPLNRSLFTHLDKFRSST
jgi:ADP-ribose pyrophosphatase YjhB (NUDIX family)